MHTLYHHPICPLSRQIRIYLKELNIEFIMIREDYWNRRPEFLKINPSGTVPILEIDDRKLQLPSTLPVSNKLFEIKNGIRHHIKSSEDLTLELSSSITIPVILVGNYSIIEYLHEACENFHFMPKEINYRGEVRKHLTWFNDKFYREVSKILIDEKMIRLLRRAGAPRVEAIKIAKLNLGHHLRYLADLLQNNSYIFSDKVSCADIAAAAQISTIDYFGEINWDSWPQIRHWYSLIKSRPGFKPLLQDQIAGFKPPKEYAIIDF